jgi:NAD(P)-dependent dehydrogenase (short-subunit alcohol dehydrogenase family)
VTGRVAVVAGGTGALGQAICRHLLLAGATVCVPYAVREEWDALPSHAPAEHRSRLLGDPADVTDEASFGAFVQQVVGRHRRLDVLVNAVGGFAGGDLVSTSLDDWNRMMALNLTSAVVGCRAALPAMAAARYGRIVNVASRAVVPPAGGFIAYTVSKAAVITLTQALAREVPAGVTVNAVLPSTMDTPANRRAMPDADRSGWVSPDTVASAIALLASEAAGSISGTLVPI